MTRILQWESLSYQDEARNAPNLREAIRNYVLTPDY